MALLPSFSKTKVTQIDSVQEAVHNSCVTKHEQGTVGVYTYAQGWVRWDPVPWRWLSDSNSTCVGLWQGRVWESVCSVRWPAKKAPPSGLWELTVVG